VKALLLLLISLSLYAADINTLIQKAYSNNPTIQKLSSEIELNNYDIANSILYKNPVLTLGINDINFDEPSKRDLEAMQAEYITISQEFTDSDKLDIKKQIENSDKKISILLLEEQKDRIVKTLYQYYFAYEQLTQKIKLNEQKKANIAKISKYHTNHIQHKKAFQEILNNDLNIDKLSLQIIFDKEKQKQILINTSELVGETVRTIEPLNKKLTPMQTARLEEHKLLLIEKENIQKRLQTKELAKENQSSDYTLSAGYFHRDQFDDYMNVAIKFPLNIYGKEKNNLLKARKQVDIAHSKYAEVKNSLKKRYDMELSKRKLNLRSLEYIHKINQHLEKEKELILNKNSIDSLIEVLMIDNKLIENMILKTNYNKELQIANIQLYYLSSNLQRIRYE